MTFKDLESSDMAWMKREDIIELVSSTFTSKIIDDTKGWTIIEAEWFVLNKEDELNRMRFKNMIDKKFKIYFTIYNDVRESPYNNYFIVRGKSISDIDRFVNYAKIKDSSIINTKDDYTCGNSFSTILEGDGMCRLFYSLEPIPYNTDVVFLNNRYYTLSCLSGGDCRLGEKLDYLSDILIGSDIDLFYKNGEVI